PVRVRVRVRSPRGAPAMAIVIPALWNVGFKVEGHEATPRTYRGFDVLALLAVPTEGVVVDLDVRGPPETYHGQKDSVPVTLYDRSPGVPPGSKAAAAVRARDGLAGAAVPSQDGDITFLRSNIDL